MLPLYFSAHPHPLSFLPPFFVTSLPFVIGFGTFGACIVLIPYWFIFKKAGFSPWIALLMIVPLVNLITLYVVAFSAWKVVPVSQVYPDPGPPARI